MALLYRTIESLLENILAYGLLPDPTAIIDIWHISLLHMSPVTNYHTLGGFKQWKCVPS